MAEDMTLHWGSSSPASWGVMIALEEKNLQGYNSKMLSFLKMEHKTEEVLALNPRGQLPVFTHGDITLSESSGICLYLENQFKSRGNQLIPDSPAEQALMYQRMLEGLTFKDRITDFVFYDFMTPEEVRLEAARRRNAELLSAEVKLWEGYLEKVPEGCYLAGREFSLADVKVFPCISGLFNYGLTQERYPNLTAYYNRLKDRPSIKASWPPYYPEKPEGLLKDI